MTLKKFITVLPIVRTPFDFIESKSRMIFDSASIKEVALDSVLTIIKLLFLVTPKEFPVTFCITYVPNRSLIGLEASVSISVTPKP